jgi:hypothetical protein
MQTKIVKVIAQSETMYVQSRKIENGPWAKCFIRLRERGGEHEDEYQCALFGSLAERRFTPGTTVAAGLRFSTHENNGNWYQDIVAYELNVLAN